MKTKKSVFFRIEKKTFRLSRILSLYRYVWVYGATASRIQLYVHGKSASNRIKLRFIVEWCGFCSRSPHITIFFVAEFGTSNDFPPFLDEKLGKLEKRTRTTNTYSIGLFDKRWHIPWPKHIKSNKYMIIWYECWFKHKEEIIQSYENQFLAKLFNRKVFLFHACSIIISIWLQV